jgi:hypothetical protein
MADIAVEHAQLVLDAPEAPVAGSGRLLSLHTVSPVLIGIATPLVAAVIAGPGVLAGVHLEALALLASVFLAAAAIYIYCVLVPGEIVAASFDPEGRMVMLVHAGRFAITNREIHFSEVADVRLVSELDTTGNARRMALLELRNGHTLRLPAGTEASHVLSAREIMGLA